MFESSHFKKLGCVQRVCSNLKLFYLYLQMTCFGVPFVIVIDVILKVQAAIKVLTIPFSICKIKGRGLNQIINEGIQNLIEWSTEMNDYMIQNMKIQSSYTQMLFEDLPMILLDIVVFSGWLKVPEVKSDRYTGKTLTMQVLTSCASIILTLSLLYYQSKALKENMFEYMLECLKQKIDWIPFNKQILNRTLKKDINFGQLTLQSNYYFIDSNDHGNYSSLLYKFSDQTLMALAKTIQESKLIPIREFVDENQDQPFELAESNLDDTINMNSAFTESRMSVQGAVVENNVKIQEKIENYQPKLIFGKSLHSVTVHIFLSFMDVNQTTDEALQFVLINFNLSEVQWIKLIKNSFNHNKTFEVIDGQPPRTNQGKPLLQVCADNERLIMKKNKQDDEINCEECQWLLQELMMNLLEICECDPNIKVFNQKDTLLSYCIKNGKFKAAQMIITKSQQNSLNLMQKNKDGTTAFELIIKTLVENYENQYIKKQSEQLIRLIMENQASQINQQSSQVCQSILDQQISQEQLKDQYKQLQQGQDDLENDHEESRQTFNLQNTLLQQTDRPVMDQRLNEDIANANFSVLVVILQLLIEYSSLFDFFSDLIIVYALAHSPHTAWLTFSIFTMLAPFYTVYTSILKQLIVSNRRKRQANCNICIWIVNCLMILPTNIIILMIIDLYLISQAIIVLSILFFITPCSIGARALALYDAFQNKIMNCLFGLQLIEIQGFRSQRTLLQFQLESVPQIFFQIYLLIRLKQLHITQEGSQLGVSKEQIWFSIVCSIVHVILELINIVVESRTSNTDFFSYLVACYNSKDNWMPRIKDFQDCNQDNQMIIVDKPGLFCSKKCGYRIGFRFSDLTLDIIVQIISMMAEQNDQKRKTLLIDESFLDTNIIKMTLLATVSNNKINLQFTQQYLQNLKRQTESSGDIMQMLKSPDSRVIGKSNDCIVHQVIESKQNELIDLLIELKANFNIKSLKSNKSAILKLFQYQNFEMVAKLHDHRKELGIEESFKEDFKLYDLKSLEDYEQEDENHSPQLFPIVPQQMKAYLAMIATLWFDPQKLIPIKHQFSYLKSLKDLLEPTDDEVQNRNNLLQAQLIYYIFWGASPCPELYLESSFIEASEEDKEQLQTWAEAYPQTVTIKRGTVNKQFTSEFLCQFVLFRKIFLDQFIKRFDTNDIANEIEWKRLYQCHNVFLDDFVLLHDILDEETQTLELKQLQRLDKLVDLLGLDKNRVRYFDLSRGMLSEEDQANCIEEKTLKLEEQEDFIIKIPDNVACIKSLEIHTDAESNEIGAVNNCQFDQKHMRTFTREYDLEKSESQASESQRSDSQRSESQRSESQPIQIIYKDDHEHEMEGDTKIKCILLSDILKNNIQGGDMIKGLVLQDVNAEQIFNCEYKFEFYKQIKDEQFADISDIEILEQEEENQ